VMGATDCEIGISRPPRWKRPHAAELGDFEGEYDDDVEGDLF
jgi:hypothetical protein